MFTDIDRIGLATANLMENITDKIHDISSRPVGHGGYSDIYKAVWRSPYGEMQVAVKVIRTLPMPSGLDDMPRVLRREIRVWKRLLHRNIHMMCGFYDGYGSAPALVSLWYDNGDINSYVRRHAADPNVDTLKFKLFADIMSGLKFLHDNYIIHGDIKGGNVLISDDGVARLCDFGLSRLLLEHSQSITHTGVKGTSRWMAPELLLVDGARHSYDSDIWACGCLFIEVWSDVFPYHTKANDSQVILALSREEPPSRPLNMPDSTWSMVEACCNFKESQRPWPLDILIYISLHLVMQKVSDMITLAHPIDSAVSDLLRKVEESLRAADPQHVSALYIMTDAELATNVIRLFACWNLSSPFDRFTFFDDAVNQWCLATLGIGDLYLPAGVTLRDVEDEDFVSKFSGLHESAKLLPLARLVERARPGLARLFMSQFATPAPVGSFNIDTPVLSVAWFPDGNCIAIGCEDRRIRILDLAGGATLLRLVGHTYVRQVSVSPNGKLLASCDIARSIRLRDAETGLAIGAPMIGHTNPVLSVAFSPDGRHIVSGSSDEIIRIWGTDTCTSELAPLRGHAGTVLSVAYSPDGSRIVSGSWDKTVRVWDAHKGDTILTLHGHAHSVQSVAYSPDGLRIVSGSLDRTVRVWDATTGQEVGTPLEGHSDWIRSVAYSPDGTRIVSGSDDRTIRIWDAATASSIATIRGHTEWVSSVAFSPDGKRLASASADGTVRIWDATDSWRHWDI